MVTIYAGQKEKRKKKKTISDEKKKVYEIKIQNNLKL